MTSIVRLLAVQWNGPGPTDFLLHLDRLKISISNLLNGAFNPLMERPKAVVTAMPHKYAW